MTTFISHQSAFQRFFSVGYKYPARVVLALSDYIVQSAVKDELGEMNVSADFYDALDEEVADLLADAARRADENDRKTVQPRDL